MKNPIGFVLISAKDVEHINVIKIDMCKHIVESNVTLQEIPCAPVIV